MSDTNKRTADPEEKRDRKIRYFGQESQANPGTTLIFDYGLDVALCFGEGLDWDDLTPEQQAHARTQFRKGREEEKASSAGL